MVITDTIIQVELLLNKWYSSDSESRLFEWLLIPDPYPGFDQARELRSKWTFYDTLLAIQRLALQYKPGDAQIIQGYLRRAEQVVAHTEVTESSGQLRCLQDLVMISSTMLARELSQVGQLQAMQR